MQNAEEEIIEIYSPRCDLEATMLSALLNQNGIKAVLQESYSRLSKYYSFETTHDFGRILVFKKDADKARKLIDDYLSSLKDEPPE